MGREINEHLDQELTFMGSWGGQTRSIDSDFGLVVRFGLCGTLSAMLDVLNNSIVKLRILHEIALKL